VSHFFSLGAGQVIFDDRSLTGTRITDEKHWLASSDVAIQQISQSGSVQSSYVNLSESHFFLHSVRHYLCLPLLPVVFRRLAEVIKCVTSLWEFNLSDRSPERIELLLIFLIILSASDGPSVSPHASKNKQSLVCDFLSFLLQCVQGLNMLNKQCV